MLKLQNNAQINLSGQISVRESTEIASQSVPAVLLLLFSIKRHRNTLYSDKRSFLSPGFGDFPNPGSLIDRGWDLLSKPGFRGWKIVGESGFPELGEPRVCIP